MPMDPKVMELVTRFHGSLIALEKFDSENVRPRVETKESHPPRQFAIISTYLRSLAHVRTLIALNNPSHFQAIAIAARALFELAVELPLIDKVDRGPEKHAVFSDVERLRVARQIVEFHRTEKVEEPLKHLWVYEEFISKHAAAAETKAKELWPQNPQPTHWSALKLPKRAAKAGAPFAEIYNVHYAELSWFTHPGVGAVATLDAGIYPAVCANAYGIAIRCYVETLEFMIAELKLADSDGAIVEKLEFARHAGFAQ
jgi:hypothetical protein